MTINVIKRNGTKEALDIDKLHKVIINACDGLSGVSASEIELRSQIQFTNNMKTSDIQETMIKSAADLISADAPNYQYVAGRLINYNLRKEVYGDFTPPKVFEHYMRYMKAGFYTKELLRAYTLDDWARMDKIIKHNRDENLTYAAMEQLRGKYLIKDRTTGIIFETPQMAFLLIAATGFMGYPKETRMVYVEAFYNALSTFDISLPTPVMAGVRTQDKQFSSCVLIETDDTLNSIIATTGSIIKYVSQKAGIGLGGNLRSLSSPVRGGRVSHTGDIAFFKLFNAAIASCSQGGVRRGSGTLNYVFFHPEIEDLIVLKNNKGTEENRIRTMDYCLQVNKLFYQRAISGGNISLFSINDTPDLYEAFYKDDALFEELYLKYEASRTKRKTIDAMTFFQAFVQERKDTGRIYLQNIDHCNNHGPYKRNVAPIKMTNLCVEITEHTKPLQSLDDPNGEIALCTLAAINLGNMEGLADFERCAELLCRFLDNLIDYQEYPVLAAELSTKKRRHIGIGVINLAYWMAKNGIPYSNIDREGLTKIHELAEMYSYSILKASNKLAQEFGACELIAETKWAEGVLPVHTYKREVDELVITEYHCDWATLQADTLRYGMRFSTHMAGMPSETSSQVSNSTNGFEPIKAIVVNKQSRDGVLPQVAPESRRLKYKYDMQWDQQSPKGYLKVCAVFQKFMDQAISVNTSYNSKFFPNGEIPMSVLIEDILLSYKWGNKNLYYHNSNDQAGEVELAPLAEGSSKEEDCDSCKI